MENEERNYSVYKHTNEQNGKVYYGIAQDPVNRWNKGCGYSTNPSFWRDIIAYGWRNFRHEIIFKELTKEEASIVEGLLIQEMQTYLPDNGYNQNYRSIEFEEICEDDEKEEGSLDYVRVKRRGRNGQPVVYKDKYYPSIKALAEELNEDMTIISQGLNPNCSRKLPSYLAENGLRYASEEEINSANKPL